MMRALVAIFLAACNAGGATLADASATTDAGADAVPGSAGSWRLEQRLATSLAALGDTAINAGRPARVVVGVDLGPCDEIAMPRLDFATNQITIGLAAWVPIDGPCTSTARSIVRPVMFVPGPFSSGSWVIAATGTSDTVTVTIAPEPSDCNPARSPCADDCDCPMGERCLSNDAPGGPTTVCATSCEVDRDCQGGSCLAAGSGPSWSCVATPTECDDGRPCRTGWSCAAGACLPDFTLAPTTRGPCVSDADCMAGLRCVQAADQVSSPSCQAVCETDGPWVPGPSSVLHARGGRVRARRHRRGLRMDRRIGNVDECFACLDHGRSKPSHRDSVRRW